MLGFSYVTAVILGYGLVGAYAGIVLTHVCWAAIVVAGFRWSSWADTAAALIAEGSASESAAERG